MQSIYGQGRATQEALKQEGQSALPWSHSSEGEEEVRDWSLFECVFLLCDLVGEVKGVVVVVVEVGVGVTLLLVMKRRTL